MQREILKAEADVMTYQRSGMCFVVLNHSGQRKVSRPRAPTTVEPLRLADHHGEWRDDEPQRGDQDQYDLPGVERPYERKHYLAITEDERASAACKNPSVEHTHRHTTAAGREEVRQ